MHSDRRKGLVKLLADADQQVADLTSVLEAANMPLPDWFHCSEQLAEMEQVRAHVEGKLRAE